MEKKTVLFICTQNSARSQMAEGLLRSIAGDRFDVFSAGINPFRVNPYAIAAMQKAGIDISGHRSKSIDEFNGCDIDYAITVCDNAKENCPYFPSAKLLIHHSFEDPAAATGSDEEIMTEFERVRDNIRDWLKEAFNDGLLQ